MTSAVRYITASACLVLSAASVLADHPGWRPHLIRQGDGRGGWKLTLAETQIMHAPQNGWTCGFGILQMDNGELALADVEQGKLLSYRRGCEAIISRDNGLTWDLAGKYILDEWEYFNSHNATVGQCGHLCAALVKDGSIITLHNNYLTMGMTLIRWRP